MSIKKNYYRIRYWIGNSPARYFYTHTTDEISARVIFDSAIKKLAEDEDIKRLRPELINGIPPGAVLNQISYTVAC